MQSTQISKFLCTTFLRRDILNIPTATVSGYDWSNFCDSLCTQYGCRVMLVFCRGHASVAMANDDAPEMPFEFDQEVLDEN